jgi:hypothetical protein
MSTHVIGSLTARVTTICLLGFALGACERGAAPTPVASDAGSELTWARTALERNPQLEVLASDADAGVFTVRNKATGEVLALKLDEIAAAPVAQLKSLAVPSAPAPAASPAAPSAPEPLAAAPAATPAPPAQPATHTPAVAPSPPAAPVNGTNYTVERSAGQVRVSGPGVSIVSAGPGETVAASSDAGQRTVDPFICEGRRMIHLDNRNIYVDGDAITLRGGCEMYITNSRIIASGTGIVVHDATVHVSNSHIEGARGSFDADDRAKLYVRSSTFQGVPKRTQLATVQDQGGNRWR